MERQSHLKREFRMLESRPLRIRLLALSITVLLFLTSSPPLLAITMSNIGSGVPGASVGGQGSAPNLQNAGAASAALTAAMTQKAQQQSAAVVAAMKKVQGDAAAAAKANPANLANGLSLNWLHPRDGFAADGTPLTTSWSGASITSAKDALKVDIKQTAQNAYIYWKNFNVGPKTKVNFDQSAGGNDAGNWVAFNKVMGSLDPSHIYGQINAQGQVYILNQNGILFHNGSEVNVHALVASSLPINENLAGDALKKIQARGLMNNPDNQFLFTALPVPSGKIGPVAAFTPDPLPANGLGNVVVEQGAVLSSPVDASHTGGLVALIAPSVHNDGTISTPNGQTILAAGLQVGLKPHASADPSLRGLDVYVGKVADGSILTHDVATGASSVSGQDGTALNNGLISVPQGNVTITGKTVRQNGAIDSTTSVALNGRVDLLASFNTVVNPSYRPDGSSGDPLFYKDTGLVETGPGSTIRILPEWSSDATVIGSSLSLNSLVSIVARDVHFGSDSTLVAPGAAQTSGALSEFGATLASGVSVDAGSWFNNGAGNIGFLHDAGQIYIDSGSLIDVSGSTDVRIDGSQNFIKLQLRGPELANSPLQRNGPIRGKDITVDTRLTGSYNGQYWVGTPLGDVTGYVGLIQKKVGQLTMAGGSISLLAGDSVVMRRGAGMNVSGGWAQYSGGYFSTTKLRSSTGGIVDIANAVPNQIYTGIVKDVPVTYQAPYLSGGNGGSLTVQASSVALDGGMSGLTVTGSRQLRTAPKYDAGALPNASSFNLRILRQALLNATMVGNVSPYAPTLTFSQVKGAEVPDFMLGSDGQAPQLPASRTGSIALDPGIASGAGFGSLSIMNHDGAVIVPSGVMLAAGPGGSVSFDAANISVNGGILAEGGGVSMTVRRASYSILNGINLGSAAVEPILDVHTLSATGEVVAQYGLPDASGNVGVLHADGSITSVPVSSLSPSDSGTFTLGHSGRISTAGLLVDDFHEASRYALPMITSGGAITIAGYSTRLLQGGVLDVSGGVRIGAKGSLAFGNAGSLSVSGGTDPEIKDIHNGGILLASTLRGYAGLLTTGTGGTPGSLSISAPAIRLGGGGAAGVLTLGNSFFSQGGFSSFSLTGVGIEGTAGDYVPGASIASGAVIQPNVASYRVSYDGDTAYLESYQPTAMLGFAPSLSLRATGLKDDSLPVGTKLLVRGELVQEAGSSIILNPRITFPGGVPSPNAGTLSLSGMTVSILGSLKASGGSILISGANRFASNDPAPTEGLTTVDLGPSARLSTAGVALFANDPKGLREHFGSVLNGGAISVSGNIIARKGALLDASGATGVFDDFFASYRSDSSGGAIALRGGEFLYSDATLVSRSGGVSAAGGSLNVGSGRFYGPEAQPRSTDLTLAIAQSGSVVNAAGGNSDPIIGTAPTASDGIASGGGHLVADSFMKGGFDSATLAGNVLFNGPVSLRLPGNLAIATGGILSTDSTLALTASRIALGRAFSAPLSPTDSALVTVFGNLVDPYFAKPVYGSGKISAKGSVIDVGNVSLSGVGNVSLDAGKGVIRGDGTFAATGDVTFRSSLLYPVSGTSFTATVFNHDAGTGEALSSGGVPGSITLLQQGSSALPLSAGGSLAMYASSIVQSGSLAAPFGSIVLGAGKGGSNPRDPVSGMTAPDTASLNLSAGSVTTVSGTDARNGTVLSVPYGTSTDGTSWIDPSGTLITTTGLPGRNISLYGSAITTETGSLLNLQGGGNISAQRWVSGLGGTINWLGSPSSSWGSGTSYSQGDLVSYEGAVWSARLANSGQKPVVGSYWTKVPQTYAILPGYRSGFAPTGYADGSLAIGSQILMNGGDGLPGGSYTLLPASYANIPGAFLLSVAAQKRDTLTPVSMRQQDGSFLVSGTLFNGIGSIQSVLPDQSLFTVSSPSVVASKVDYRNINADSFFASSGSTLPKNAGKLVVSSSGSLKIAGAVNGAGGAWGLGSVIDLSAPGVFAIGGVSGAIELDSTLLNSWNYGSLLIGGSRGVGDAGKGTPITVSASAINVAPGVMLSGSDIILASLGSIELGEGASISSQVVEKAPDEQITLTGDGALLRVSGDSAIALERRGSGSSRVTGLTLGKDVVLSGTSLILDSSAGASIDQTAVIKAPNVAISSGRMVLALDTAVPVDPADQGSLVLSGSTLSSLQGARSISLTSYSSLGIYGSGSFGSTAMESLRLTTGEIRGFGLGGSVISLTAGSIMLDNSRLALGSGPVTTDANGSPLLPDGILEFNAGTVVVGANQVALNQFAQVSINASGAVLGSSKGGLVVGTAGVPTDLYVTTPLLTCSGGSEFGLQASGDLRLQAPDPGSATISNLKPGLGAKLLLQGASVFVDTAIVLPSGAIDATAASGDLVLGSSGTALLDVSGGSKTFKDVIQYTDAGRISLSSTFGNVVLGASSSLKLDAAAKGSAGTLSVSAPLGIFQIDPASLLSSASVAGKSGSFNLDVGTLSPDGNSVSRLSSITSKLADAGFSGALSFRIRTGDVAVDNLIVARSFSLTADGGAIDVTPDGVVDASGVTGGSIAMQASGSVVLEPNSFLSVKGDHFDNAGKGGSVFLSAGASSGGTINPDAVLDLQTGSGIDLGVTAPGNGIDQSEGSLHLRGPQLWNTDDPANPSPSDVAIAHFDSQITGGSRISIEAYKLYDLSSSGVISQGVRETVQADAAAFFGNNGSSATANLILNRLLQNQDAGVTGKTSLLPGVEIMNQNGNLLLNSDWDLSLSRYGSQYIVLDDSGQAVRYSGPGTSDNNGNLVVGKDAGFLSLRASGNVVLNGSISDGFGDSMNPAANAGGGGYGLYFAPLLPLVKDASGIVRGQTSWAYSISSGNDLSSADFLATSGSGAVKLGVPTANANLIESFSDPSGESLRLYENSGFLASYQVIRTGTGDISIAAGGDIQLLNQFASVYTAGTQVIDPTLGGNFDLPSAIRSYEGLKDYGSWLGVYQQPTVATPQFSANGGNVSMRAGGNIAHLQLLTSQFDSAGNVLQDPYAGDPSLTADSSRQLPGNWLMRRSSVDASGSWSRLSADAGQSLNNETTSTAWWVDFSNFFECVGTLGGGNISMTAVGGISNVDAAAPTQGRLASRNGGLELSPAQGFLSETGGGDVMVKAGGNLDAGVYYVERGNAVIHADGSIVSNKTRDVNGDYLYALGDLNNRTREANPNQEIWLPTSFILGRGTVSVSAGGSALLGPVANLFLLPQGINNDNSYKTYFSTYDRSVPVDGTPSFSAQALGGDLDFRTQILGLPSFSAWSVSQTIAVVGSHRYSGAYQPWIRTSESDPGAVGLLASLLPSKMELTAYSGNISLQGSLLLTPASQGNISLYAQGRLDGMSQQGVQGRWVASSINLSDASPGILPATTTPLLQSYDPQDGLFLTKNGFLANLAGAFSESGSYQGNNGVLQTKLLRHDSSLLHLGDTDPLRIYAMGGDLSGITLFSPKLANIYSSGDITDIGFYIQNVSKSDVSSVTAGRSIIAYDPQSFLQQQAQAAAGGFYTVPLQSGDIQISGQGVLKVAASGNVDLGNGPNFADGTGVGITSIGNSRNPALPFGGADVQLSAGLDPAASSQEMAALINKAAVSRNSLRYYSDVAALLGQGEDSNLQDKFLTTGSWDGLASSGMSDEEKGRIAMVLFDVMLRDAGRDHNNANSSDYGSYRAGSEAVATLFGAGFSGQGSIKTWSRDIRTKNGGSITITAPGGGISLANTTIGSTLAPPGIVTEHGGSINIYTRNNVDIGIGRIFTLRGGDIMIWSDKGNIAAGSSAKTIASAPPTRVLIDPQSGNVQTDLAGLATGGGIGVLATVKGAAVGNVDLIAPSGVIDAGDAGIRSSGNLNLAATKVLNADNIAVLGISVGAPASAPASAPPPAAPPMVASTAASTAAAANNSAADKAGKNAGPAAATDESPSVISVEVLGYGGGDGDEERDKKAATAGGEEAPRQASL